MTIRVVYLDFGGVIVRTEDRAPRTRLAERFSMSYREIEKIFFESESSRRASRGEITEDDHWVNVMKLLAVDPAEKDQVVEQFFSGDCIDRTLLKHVEDLRPQVKIGLISNAWSGLREWIEKHDMKDNFDQMIISAEIGAVKPDEEIYRLALGELGVAPGEAIFMDDMLPNVQAAQALGMHGIHFIQPGHALSEMEKIIKDQTG